MCITHTILSTDVGNYISLYINGVLEKFYMKREKNKKNF